MPQDPEEGKRKRQLDNNNNTGSASRKKLKQPDLSPMEALPAELFCQVLSFVGPTSSTLVDLTQLNKHMNFTMNACSRAMLPRAKSNFRIPLESCAPQESSTCLFVRHARTCSSVLSKLTQLRTRLNNDQNDDVATIDTAMDTAMELLQVGPTLSVSLERQILSTAGKCGGKAFKMAKRRMLENAEETNTTSRQTNTERLDMARLIMQIVVFRDLQIAKPSSNLTSVQNQTADASKKTLGCV